MQILWMVISLLGVLGLIFLMFYGLKMLGGRVSTSGGRLKVIDRATLGRDSMLLVVSVCGKLMLVGVSSQRIEKLTDLDMTEEEYTEAAFPNGKGVLPFSDVLSNFMRKTPNELGENNESQNEEIEKIEEDEENNSNS